MKTAADSPKIISAPLRVAAFRRFVSANLISTTGSAMAPLALAYSVIEEGGGAGSLGLVLAMNTVPTIVFLLAGGLLADRLSRSLILFLGNLLAAGAQGAVAVTVANGHATTSSIAVCAFVSGTAASFTVPATQSVVAQIVPVEYLQQANALLRIPSNAVRVLGPVVGGFIVAASGPARALAWDAFTFAAAAFLLLGLRLDAPLVTSGILADLRAIVAWTTAFQQHVPQAEQGRMSAFNGAGERLAIPFGYLITALVAHSWDGRSVLLACAGTIAAAVVLPEAVVGEEGEAAERGGVGLGG
ncbi:MFS transporter [Streptomyces sp. NPDC058371]|uniref:MFS transporter n=1 Tax=Streptomyces sp. NPDC058371 TaxID=3346463 RepID=UPI003662D886